jgi:hypothetical protein
MSCTISGFPDKCSEYPSNCKGLECGQCRLRVQLYLALGFLASERERREDAEKHLIALLGVEELPSNHAQNVRVAAAQHFDRWVQGVEEKFDMMVPAETTVMLEQADRISVLVKEFGEERERRLSAEQIAGELAVDSRLASPWQTVAFKRWERHRIRSPEGT